MLEALENEQLDEGTKEVQGEHPWSVRPASPLRRLPPGNTAFREETESYHPNLRGERDGEYSSKVT
jgi:hypothetical protein